MNKKYLKENNLYEAHKQFMRLCEWSYIPSSLEEDDNEEDPNGGQSAPPPIGGDPNAAPQDNGGMPPMDNNAQGGALDPNGAPPMGDPNGMPPEDNGAPQPPTDGDMGPEPPMNEPPMGGNGEEEPKDDDTVIDVDDITNAQETTNNKVNTVGKNLGKVDDKITNLLQSLDKMQKMIDNNNQQIEALKGEMNHRLPTPTEKLDMRSLDSYPFNVKPTEYWRDKSATSNYQAYADNEEPTTDEYEITNDDVDNFNEREMADSFNVDDDMDFDINKIFGLR